MERVQVRQVIAKDGEVLITGLPYKKGQAVEIIVSPQGMTLAPRACLTVGRLRRSGLIGMWQDRRDIDYSSVYIRVRLRPPAVSFWIPASRFRGNRFRGNDGKEGQSRPRRHSRESGNPGQFVQTRKKCALCAWRRYAQRLNRPRVARSMHVKCEDVAILQCLELKALVNTILNLRGKPPIP